MIQFSSPEIKFDWYRFFTPQDGGFSVEECEKIISQFSSLEKNVAAVGEGSINNEIRKSNVSWLKYSAESHWIYERIGHACAGANSHYWKLLITSFQEPLQLGHYSGGDHYNWHIDSGGGNFSIRKLSSVVLLSDPKDFEGGELEFHLGGKSPKMQGSIIVFPSYIEHRVTPIFKGERKSLVSWISGPPLR